MPTSSISHENTSPRLSQDAAALNAFDDSMMKDATMPRQSAGRSRRIRKWRWDYRPLTSVGVALVLLALLIGPPNAAAGTFDDAQDVINQLNPINLALGPLIDRAIARGDEALARRLQQLQEIIQQALATADAILARRIADVDGRAQNRLSQLAKTIDDSIGQLNGVINDTIPILDERVQQRIRQMQTDFGQLIEAINWLNIDPVVNLGPEGMSIYKESGPTTSIFVSGVGLQKAGVSPRAWILLGGTDHELVRDASTPSGAKFSIDNTKLPLSGCGNYKLRFVISKGRRLDVSFIPDGINTKAPMEITVPLHICVLGPYSLSATMIASGERWERKTVPSDYGPDPYTNCNKGEHPASLLITARPQGDWEVDSDIGHGGLTSDGCDGREEHSCNWTQTALGLWCSAEHSPSGGWVKAINVQVHLRKRVKERACGKDVGSLNLSYGQTVQLQLHPPTAIGVCGEAGLSAVPEVRTEVIIHRPYGQSDVVKVLSPNVPVRLPDDPIRLQIDANGILEARLEPIVSWHTSPAIAAPTASAKR